MCLGGTTYPDKFPLRVAGLPLPCLLLRNQLCQQQHARHPVPTLAGVTTKEARWPRPSTGERTHNMPPPPHNSYLFGSSLGNEGGIRLLRSVGLCPLATRWAAKGWVGEGVDRVLVNNVGHTMDGHSEQLLLRAWRSEGGRQLGKPPPPLSNTSPTLAQSPTHTQQSYPVQGCHGVRGISRWC